MQSANDREVSLLVTICELGEWRGHSVTPANKCRDESRHGRHECPRHDELGLDCKSTRVTPKQPRS